MLRARDSLTYFEAGNALADLDLSSRFDQEPEFDRNRVIWDIDYRRRVIALLKHWHEARQSPAQGDTHLRGIA